MERIIFYILALIMIVFAMQLFPAENATLSNLPAICTYGYCRNLFLIDYNFLAAIQLTVYAGGILC